MYVYCQQSCSVPRLNRIFNSICYAVLCYVVYRPFTHVFTHSRCMFYSVYDISIHDFLVMCVCVYVNVFLRCTRLNSLLAHLYWLNVCECVYTLRVFDISLHSHTRTEPFICVNFMRMYKT